MRKKEREKKESESYPLATLSTFHIFMNLSMSFLNHETEEIVPLQWK